MTESTDFMTGPFLLSILVFVFLSFLHYSFCFCFGFVRQIKPVIRQLLGARKYTLSYRIVSYLSDRQPRKNSCTDRDVV